MMKPEWKKKWLAALRSGEYKQGKNKLRDGDRFCCIGVLCDIVDDSHWMPNEGNGGFSYRGRISFLDDGVRRVVRLRPSAVSHLMDMNDKRGKDFYQIANWIEEYL